MKILWLCFFILLFININVLPCHCVERATSSRCPFGCKCTCIDLMFPWVDPDRASIYDKLFQDGYIT
jgi:hypothetical protein